MLLSNPIEDKRWTELVASSHRLADPVFRRDALVAAREMFHPFRALIEELVGDLHRQRYRFAHPEEIYSPPQAGVLELVAELENHGHCVPLSLQAWYLEVGAVDLTGSHPDWPRPGYSFDPGRPWNEEPEIWYTDALVVAPAAYCLSRAFAEWQEVSEIDGAEEAGPFLLEIAPDELHKANVSGGAPYALETNRRVVDGLLLHQSRGVSFTTYLRHALLWRGFPGFAYYPDRPIQSPTAGATR